ncbi:MAG: flagellar hook basal-body protein [Syntrophaceae bacterium]|nr:flagellar hook basal-body protein [Syntrophaceae bacterium]
MSYEISTVAMAMDRRTLQLQQIANNLANASTPGYRAQHFHFLEKMEVNHLTSHWVEDIAHGLVTNFAAGLPRQTNNPLDLQIRGEGFFVIGVNGEERFTKRGDFTLNAQRELVTQEGLPVLGEAGPLTLPEGQLIRVADDGSIFVDQNLAGRLRVVDFDDRDKLFKEGGGMFRDDEGTAGRREVNNPLIVAGFVELGNVNTIKEMTDMIANNRIFETYQKIIQTMTEQDELSTSRVGKINS